MSYWDSHVKVYHGPRRGGKTASASADGCISMINGKKVFSNYPIDFWFKEDKESEAVHYQSQPLICEELLRIDDPEIQDKYKRSLCIWDETALSLYSRNSQAVFNKMAGLMITLIGKLELSFDFTTQFLSLLDKNIRIQMDALIFCSDLSFRYPHLQRGSVISQIWQDISGRYTGSMYEYSQMTFQQTFYAKWIWNAYDTFGTFDILEAQKKVTWNEIRDDVSGYKYSDDEGNLLIIRHLITELQARGTGKIAAGSFWNLAKARGFTGKTQKGNQLMASELDIERQGTTNPYFDLAMVTV